MGVIEPNVAIAAHGRFHAFELARGLHERECLAQLATTYPAVFARRFLPRPIHLRTAPWLEVWRRASQRTRLLPPADPMLCRAFGRFAARALPHDANLLVGWSSATLEAIAPAKARDMRVVLERGSTHIQHQAAVLEAEYARFGLTARPVAAEMIDRELAEYDAADAIFVPSRFAAATFAARGVPETKIVVNPFGVDPIAPVGAPRHNRDQPTILFVGRVGVRKGIPTLLRAFAPLSRSARLRLVGPLEPGIETIIAAEPAVSVEISGPVPKGEIPGVFGAADVFCLPSVEEGFALVILEAMAAGVPIIATEASGAGEAVRSGVEGYIVPEGDIGALTDALDKLASDVDLRRDMGHAARTRVEAAFGWSHYADRAVSAYRRILAA